MTETAQTQEAAKVEAPNPDQLKAELAKEVKEFTDKWERKLLGELVPGDKRNPLVAGFQNKTTIVPLARLQMWVENQVRLLNEAQQQSLQGVWQVLQQLNTKQRDSQAGDLALDIKTEALQRLANIESKALETMMDTIAKEREAEVEKRNDEQAGRSVVDREARDSDYVKIDFTGTLDGVEFPGGKSTGFNLTLGSKTMIPGFEEGIVGMKAGETKDIAITFPEDYGQKTLAGKATSFKIVLHVVKEVKKKEEPKGELSSEQTQQEQPV